MIVTGQSRMRSQEDIAHTLSLAFRATVISVRQLKVAYILLLVVC